MTPSSTLATSSQRSVASSRKSSVSFHFITTIGSLLVVEQPADRLLVHAVGFVLEPVDLDGVRDERPCAARARRAPAAPARCDAVMMLRQLARAEAHRVEPVEPDQRRRRVDRVHHVVERARQGVDVLAIERRDERAVEPLDDLVGQEVALVLDFLDLVGLVPDRAAPARASPRAAARRAAARRRAPGSRCRTSLRAESDETPTRPHASWPAASKAVDCSRSVYTVVTWPLHGRGAGVRFA